MTPPPMVSWLRKDSSSSSWKRLKKPEKLRQTIRISTSGTYKCLAKNEKEAFKNWKSDDAAITKIQLVHPPTSCEFLNENLSTQPKSVNILQRLTDISQESSDPNVIESFDKNLAMSSTSTSNPRQPNSWPFAQLNLAQKIRTVDNSQIYDLDFLSNQATCTSINQHGKFPENDPIISKTLGKTLPNHLAPILQESPLPTQKYFKLGQKIEVDCFVSENYFNSHSRGNNYKFEWFKMEKNKKTAIPRQLGFKLKDSSYGISLYVERSTAHHSGRFKCEVTDGDSGLVSSITVEISGK